MDLHLDFTASRDCVGFGSVHSSGVCTLASLATSLAHKGFFVSKLATS